MPRNEARFQQESDGITIGALTAAALSVTFAPEFEDKIRAIAITMPIGGYMGYRYPQLVIEPGLKMIFLLAIGNLAKAYLPPAPAVLVTVGSYIVADLTHKYLTDYWQRPRQVNPIRVQHHNTETEHVNSLR
ncbi:MAG: hypothetical protein ABSF18_04725 [Gammaproteobacteria bacterium]|jgi:hypothetical protein